MIKRINFLILCLAILVGVLFVAPQFLIRQSVIRSGQPFVLSQYLDISDEAHSYFPRGREVYDGGFPAKDLFFGDGRPNILPIVPALVFTPFMVAAHGDLNWAYLILSFVLPAILFLIFYFLGQTIFEKNKAWSIFFALVGALTPLAYHSVRLFLGPVLFLDVGLKNFYPGVSTLLDRLFLNRMDDPMITYLIFLPAILFLISFWRKPKLWNAIFAGVFTGLLFHTYFHYWVYWVIVLGILFLFSLVFLRHDRNLIKYFLIFGCVAALISVPYWIHYLSFNSWPGNQEYALRIGTVTGRNFALADVWPDYLVYLAMAAAVYLVFWRRGHQRTAVLFFTFLAAIFVAWNIQLVTGFVPQPDHFRKAIGPPFLVMIFAVLYEISRRWPMKKVALVLVAGSLLLITKKAVNAALFIHPPAGFLMRYTQPPALVDSWRWIDANLQRESGIVTDSYFTSFYLSGLTSARSFLPWGGITPGSNYEMEDRFLMSNKIFGLSATTLEARLRANVEDENLGMYERYYYDRDINQLPEEKIKELVRRYRTLKVDLSGLPADYLYYGPDEKKLGQVDFSGNKNLELVYDQDSVRIYRILR